MKLDRFTLKAGAMAMRIGGSHAKSLSIFVALSLILSVCATTFAQDDGPRVYWKTREGTNIISYQKLDMSLDATGSAQFAPGLYIYPSADVDADIFILNWTHHLTLLGRPSAVSVSIVGGEIDAEVNISTLPAPFLPPGVRPGTTFSQSSSGFADPNVQLVMNLYGAQPLKSNVDLLNYEPRLVIDGAVMVAIPVGEYDEDQLVNMGLNRWYGRVGFPITYHFGTFTPGYRNSIEVFPSVWLFGDNDDFLGETLENDPLWSLEAHLTHDFTPDFFGSLDLLYRRGFQSTIDGDEVGDEVELGEVGFTLNHQVGDNLALRVGYSSNVFGDSDVDTSMFRFGISYGWNEAEQNAKKLSRGH